MRGKKFDTMYVVIGVDSSCRHSLKDVSITYIFLSFVHESVTVYTL
jgi:cystathionine beta-lyase family protein involved in aluminum resistance